jgi:hypothetical protein
VRKREKGVRESVLPDENKQRLTLSGVQSTRLLLSSDLVAYCGLLALVANRRQCAPSTYAPSSSLALVR